MEIKPLGDRIVVKPLEAENKSKGGIVLPDSVKEKPQEAKFVAVGKGKVLENGTIQTPEVKVGDKVSLEVKVDGEKAVVKGEISKLYTCNKSGRPAIVVKGKEGKK